MNNEKIIISIIKVCNLQKAKEIFDKYDKNLPRLECDGFSRVVAYILDKMKIPYQAYFGEVRLKEHHFSHHYWVISQNKIIDYRLKMWFGSNAPHGIFDIEEKFPLGPNIQNYINEKLDVEYTGQRVNWETNEIIFKILTRQF